MVISVVPVAVTNITLKTASCLTKNQSILHSVEGTRDHPKRLHVRVCVTDDGHVRMIF